MIENFNLFSCPVLREDTQLDNKKIMKYCHSIKKNDKGRTISNQGGYQSNFLNLIDKELQPLITQIGQTLTHYINICAFKNTLNYELNSMWFNINSYKDYNIPHIHPGVLFSGVYYVNAPKDSGDIVFNHPHKHLISYDWIDDIKLKQIENNSANWVMNAQNGRLYIFPSWLEHSVMPNLNKKEDRISIAFNVRIQY